MKKNIREEVEEHFFLNIIRYPLLKSRIVFLKI